MKRVLFVCIGNCIRSQMAEGFAATYGRDVIQPFSAGLSPAGYVSEIATKVMAERGIAIGDNYSKSIPEAAGAPYDLLINISGEVVPARGLAKEVRTWNVADPMSKKEPAYQEAAQQIENLVMALVLELRVAQRPTPINRPATKGIQKPR